MDNDVAVPVELEPPRSRVIPRPESEAVRMRALERERRAEAARIAALVRSMLHTRTHATD